MVAWANEWIRFLPSEVYVVTRYGFERNRMVFNAPIFEALLAVPGAAPGGMVRMFYNPADLRQMYCFDPDGNAWEVPWVLRTEDTPPISEFALARMRDHLTGMTYTRGDYQRLLRDLNYKWTDEDATLLMRRNSKSRTEEIQASQFERLQAFDAGAFSALSIDDEHTNPFVDAAELEASLGDSLTEDTYDDDSDLFGAYT